MRLKSIRLQHFRNLAFAQVERLSDRVFLLGENGQGKSNFLEAVGLLTALRSFRTSDARQLIGQGQAEASLAFEIEHETRGDTTLRLTLSAGAKELTVDGERIVKLADFIGQFPTVVFSSQDQQLVRGTPGQRRRWMDLTLASTDRSYLESLQTYHRALEARNALLRRGGGAVEMEAFERIMAPAAAVLMVKRREGLSSLAPSLLEACRLISDAAEQVGFRYEPDHDNEDPAAQLALLAACREQDLRLKTTTRGPHRDDFHFALRGADARAFASEGQQRLLVIALRLAQAEWFRSKSGIQPLLLVDDVAGELDPARRERFWRALPAKSQIIATGTHDPEGQGGAWRVIRVRGGELSAGEEAPRVS
jgi:DNA replication and repair protein RecF